MPILVHRIEEAPNISYAEFLTRVNRFKVSDVLKICNRLADWLENRSMADALLTIPASKTYMAPKPAQVYVAPSTIAFLAKSALLRSSERRQANFTDDDLRGLVYMHANLMDAFTRKPNKTIEDEHSFLLRIATEQASYQGALRRTFPRSWLILIEANRAIGDRPFDLETEWSALTGMELGKFILLGFAYYSGLIVHSAVTRNFGSSGIFKEKVTQEECEKFLGIVSATQEQFRELSAKYAVRDPLYIKSEFNALWRRPLIAIGQELLAPLPALIATRITDGIRYDLREAMREEKRNPFSEYFGKLFEEYVGRLLKWTFGDDKVHREPQYGRPRKGGPDWVVIDGDSAILIECRTSNLTVETRTTARIEDVKADMRKMFVDTLVKYPDKIADLRSGASGLDFGDVKRIQPLILTYDRICYEFIYRELAKQELQAMGRPWSDDYELLDVNDLELLTAWHATNPIPNVIDERKRRYRVRPSDFGDFLHEYGAEHGLAQAHPLLAEVQDELLETGFGAIPGGMPVDPDNLAEYRARRARISTHG